MKIGEKETLINIRFSYTGSGMFYFTYSPIEKDIMGRVMMLHGFPSWTTKNNDIAERLAMEGFEVFLPHYNGLGHSKGFFEFKKSIEQIETFYKFIKKETSDEKISLIGHSWGGFLALCLGPELNQGLQVLLAPLSIFPNDDILPGFISDLYDSYQDDCKHYANREEMIKEWQSIKDNFHLENILNKSTYSKMMIIHGDHDEVLSHTDSDYLYGLTEKKCDYYLVNDDHLLCNQRRKNIDLIQKWFLKNV